jgi:molecular chaperone DnaK
VERRLAELGDSIPENQQARAELLVTDAREALDGEAPLDRIRMLTGELQQIYQGLAAAGGQPGGQGGGPDGTAPAAGSDDDVIDADFTTS